MTDLDTIAARPEMKQFIGWLDVAVHNKAVELGLSFTELQFALHALISETRSSVWRERQ
jgi:hypothetical protein